MTITTRSKSTKASRSSLSRVTLDTLENRRLLATLLVNSVDDPAGFNPSITIGQLGTTVTLRDAFNAAVNTGGINTITFAPNLAGQTINLTQLGDTENPTALAMSNRAVASYLTIQGLTGSDGVTISRAGPNQMRLFACGIAGFSDSLTINDLTLTNGIAPDGNWGGAILEVSGTLNLNRCTLANNSAAFGGALYNRLGYINATSCTIVNNTATGQFSQGGGIYQDGGSQVNLKSCTITGNSAGQGGGLYVDATPYPVLSNTIVANNIASGLSEIAGRVDNSSHHNLCSSPDVPPTVIGNGAGNMVNGVNGNIVGVNPRLGTLANNGGPTPTVALLSRSPAINMGTTVSGITADQRGTPFFLAPDIGAFEAPAEAPGFATANFATFISGLSNTFTVLSAGNPVPTFSATGALPSGVTFTSAGTLSGIPAIGTEGVYPLVITATNTDASGSPQSASQNFTLTVARTGLVVTTSVDESNGTADPAVGAGTSLRESLAYAATLSGPQTITFDPSLAGQTITLSIVGNTVIGATAIAVGSAVTIQGLAGNAGLTINGGNALRPFYVQSGASLTANDLTIANGRGGEGGAIFNFGTLVMNRCTLRNNIATQTGGAFFNGASATLTNCTIAANHASFNGGGILNGGSLTLRSVTVAGNTVNLPTANVAAGLRNNLSAVITNTIVAGNTNLADNSPADVQGNNLGAASSNNLIGTGGSGGLANGVNGNKVGFSNAGLGTLASNGGPTQTMAVLPNSPAMDAGTVVAGISVDQRGTTRDSQPDIGAFEFNDYQSSLVVSTTADENNGTSDSRFGSGTSLREALAYAEAHPGPDTITFAPSLAGQTLWLSEGWYGNADDTTLHIFGNVTLQGPAGGVTLAIPGGTTRRHVVVESTGSLAASNLIFTGGNLPGGGGSIFNFGSLTLNNTSFTSNNTPGGGGGAIYNAGTATIAGSTFTSNHAGEGGAIQNTGTLDISTSTFSSNSSDFNGGALRLFGTTTIDRSTFSGNTVVNQGGALISFGNTSITNSTFAGNGKDAVLLWDGTANLEHLTVAYNANGGLASVFANTTLRNSIVAGNSGFDQTGTLAAGSSNNLLNVSASAAGLGSLAFAGGPTPTIELLPGSPAINAGLSLSTIDQRGIARPQGSASDLGAYERQASAAQLTSASYESLTRQAVTFTFNADASVTFDRSAFTLTNLTTNQVLNVGNLLWSADGTAATLVLTHLLPDGNYRVQAGTTTLDFFVLAGDVNRDRSVNFDDLLSLAQRYGQAGDSTQGDVNYDGQVNFDDLLALTQRYGTNLPAASFSRPGTRNTVFNRRSERVIA